jgi:Flp pilus assembly pilin Flp
MRHIIMRKQRGATIIEYGIVVALIALICAAIISQSGINTSAMFNNIIGKL